MQVNHKISKDYYYQKEKENKKVKKNYDIYDNTYDKYYPTNYSKNTFSKEKSKKDKTKYRESSSREDDYDRYSYTNKINQRSIWGSKIFIPRDSKENSTKVRTKNNSKKNSIIINYKRSDKKEIKHMKRLKRILKCLIIFNKSRSELYGKYFDIWYDKTFPYYEEIIQKSKKKKNISS